MPTGTVFRNNRTQAVRLPKAVAFPETVARVDIRVVGDQRILTPVAPTWRDWAARRQGVDPDFLADRAQGSTEERDWDQA